MSGKTRLELIADAVFLTVLWVLVATALGLVAIELMGLF